MEKLIVSGSLIIGFGYNKKKTITIANRFPSVLAFSERMRRYMMLKADKMFINTYGQYARVARGIRT